MRASSSTFPRRTLIWVLVCAAAFGAFVSAAIASSSGEVWLNNVYEQAGAGIHARLYTYFEQESSSVGTSGNWACSNGWLGAQGAWVFGNDYCAPHGQNAATPQLSDPGHGAYPWAQSEYRNDYLWGWARYCNNC